MLTQDASRLQYPVELLRVRTFTKEGKPWEEGYLLREEMAAFKSPVEVREKVLVEKPDQALDVYFKEAYLGSYTMEEVLKLRTYGSQLYTGNPNAKDACVPVMEELNSPTTVLYPRATYYLYDHLGNTRVLMKPVGSSCGNITNYAIEYLADYHPYGQLLRSWQSTSTREKYLSTQHQRDISSGLDYRNARFSDPETGLFYGVDPLASKFPAWSPYAYTMGNPVNLIDPSGMGPETVKPGSQEALEMIKNTLTKEDAQYVRLDNNGNIDRDFLNSNTNSTSGNFASLQTLVNSETMITVDLANRYSYSDSEGNVKSSDMPYYPADEYSEYDTEGNTPNGTSTGESGFLGKTLFPDKAGLQNSPTSELKIFINSKLTPNAQAEMYSHEANGHAIIYVTTGGNREAASHQYPNQGMTDQNQELIDRIITSKKETIQNREN